MKCKYLYKNPFLLIIPAIYLVFSLFLRSASGPFWQFGDPCFNYYFNALLLLKGHVPVDITHPGTPLQLLVTGIIWLLNFGHSTADIIDHALLNPEWHLGAVYYFLLILSLFTTVLLGAFVYQQTQDKWPALLSQLPILSFLVMPSFDSGTYPVIPVTANISAEPMFIIIMNLFNIFILGLYFSEDVRKVNWFVFCLAIICGLGLATKINFLIIIFAAFFLVPNLRKIQFTFIVIVSFIICTIPIISKYPQLFQWITDMVGHASRYGTGTQKFIDWGTFVFYLKLMISKDWFFIFSILLIGLYSSIGIILDFSNRTKRFMWVLSLICIMDILVIAKHFSFHYLLPGFSLLSSLWVLFYLDQKSKNRNLKPFVFCFIIIFTMVTIYFVMPYYKKLSDLSQDIKVFNAKLKSNYPACNLVTASTEDVDIFLSQEMVLQRANGTNYRLLSDELARLYPHSYYFFSEEVTSQDPSVESYGIWDFKQRILGDDLLSVCPCSLFVKYKSDVSSYPYQFHLVDQSKYLNAYLLMGSTEKAADDMFAKALDSAKRGDFQQAMMFGLKAKELNYEPRGQLEYILTMIYQELLKSNPNLLNQKQ